MAVLEPSNPELVQRRKNPPTDLLDLYRLEQFEHGVDARTYPGLATLAPTWYATKGKRIFDVVVGVILAIVMMPLLALAALVVVLSIGRPLFYRQLRVGENGRPFRIIKYRTMRPEPIIDLTDGKAVGLVVDVEPRTTFGSRLLRSLSLDELPQIFNVIRGEMSLVGPRPEVWGHCCSRRAYPASA